MSEPTPNNVPQGGNQPSSNPSNLNNNGQPNNGQPAGGQPAGQPAGGEPNNGDGKTIPVESYNVVAEKYRKAKEALDKIEAEKSEAEKKNLAEQGKFKELAEKAESEKKSLEEKYNTAVKTDRVKSIAMKLGANNPDVVVRLLDLNKVALSEDGSVDEGEVTKLVEGLKASDAYLFGGQPSAPVGNPAGGAPDGGSQVKKFKRSQLKDSKFYQANENDILEALRTGNIIED